jgi:hypothetical protein
MKKPDFDLDAAHKYFAADCFNKAWALIEKQDRTPGEDRAMVALSHASIYHWTCRPDCTDRNLSIGYWQASRIQALLGKADEARRHAEVCLGFSVSLDPFYLGYAYEALARSALVAGADAEAFAYLAQAETQCARVGRKDDRDLLRADIEGLRERSGPA